MRGVVLLGCGIILASTVVGCAPQDLSKHDAAMSDMVKAMNDMSDALESVKDDKSAKEVPAKINKVSDKLEELTGTLVKLPKVRKADEDKLIAKFKPEMDKAEARLKKDELKEKMTKAAAADPEAFLKSFQRLEAVTKKMQASMKEMGAK